MANKTISQLPPASIPFTGAELVPLVQSGATKRSTLDDFFDWATSRSSFVLASTDFGTPLENTQYLQSLIDGLTASGGGAILLPEGTFEVTDNGGAVALALKSNVTLIGTGAGTVIRLANNGNAHVINIAAGVANVALQNLRIDGNRDNQSLSGTHGLRTAGVDGLCVDNVQIVNTAGYGIGVQSGTNKNVCVKNVDISDTGFDGIDLKNPNDDNENFVFDGISVRRWGLSNTATGQAAIDMRGVVHVSNIWVAEPVKNDAVGIRFRNGEIGDANGLGAHKSSLTGFYIDMAATTLSIGVNVVARDVTASNGNIVGGYRGVLVQDSGFKASGVIVEGAGNIGIFLDDFGSGLIADSAVLTGCAARGCTSDGLRIEASTAQIFGFEGTGNTGFGLRIMAGATNTRVFGGILTGNTAGTLSDAGTDSVFVDVADYVTQNAVTSSSLALDSTGLKTATIAHGLSVTPNINNCSLSIVMETNVSDFAIGFFRVESVTSTNIVVSADVTTASATPGATFRLSAQVGA